MAKLNGLFSLLVCKLILKEIITNTVNVRYPSLLVYNISERDFLLSFKRKNNVYS